MQFPEPAIESEAKGLHAGSEALPPPPTPEERVKLRATLKTSLELQFLALTGKKDTDDPYDVCPHDLKAFPQFKGSIDCGQMRIILQDALKYLGEEEKLDEEQKQIGQAVKKLSVGSKGAHKIKKPAPLYSNDSTFARSYSPIVAPIYSSERQQYEWVMGVIIDLKNKSAKKIAVKSKLAVTTEQKKFQEGEPGYFRAAGGAGVVKKALCVSSHGLSPWVGKTLRKANPKEMEKIRKAADLAIAIGSPYIAYQTVTQNYWASKNQTFNQVTSYSEMADGDLFEKVFKNEVFKQKSLGAGDVLSILYQAMKGVQAMHAKGYMHRDLKTENFIIFPDGRVQLIDLSWAKHYLDSSLSDWSVDHVGTSFLASPEQILLLWEKPETRSLSFSQFCQKKMEASNGDMYYLNMYYQEMYGKSESKSKSKSKNKDRYPHTPEVLRAEIQLQTKETTQRRASIFSDDMWQLGLMVSDICKVLVDYLKTKEFNAGISNVLGYLNDLKKQLLCPESKRLNIEEALAHLSSFIQKQDERFLLNKQNKYYYPHSQIVINSIQASKSSSKDQKYVPPPPGQTLQPEESASLVRAVRESKETKLKPSHQSPQKVHGLCTSFWASSKQAVKDHPYAAGAMAVTLGSAGLLHAVLYSYDKMQGTHLLTRAEVPPPVEMNNQAAIWVAAALVLALIVFRAYAQSRCGNHASGGAEKSVIPSALS